MKEFVEQRAKSDCVIAAISMFTELSYEQVLEAAGDLYKPDEGTHSVGQILRTLGFNQDNYRGDNNGDGRAFKSIHLAYELHPRLLRQWMWGREAMFSVPSKNIEGGWHMIYYDGKQLWDPAPTTKNRYEEFDDIEPREVHIWQER